MSLLAFITTMWVIAVRIHSIKQILRNILIAGLLVYQIHLLIKYKHIVLQSKYKMVMQIGVIAGKIWLISNPTNPCYDNIWGLTLTCHDEFWTPRYQYDEYLEQIPRTVVVLIPLIDISKGVPTSTFDSQYPNHLVHFYRCNSYWNHSSCWGYMASKCICRRGFDMDSSFARQSPSRLSQEEDISIILTTKLS